MISDEIKSAIEERIRISNETQDEWDYGIEQCQQREIKILSSDINCTISFFLNECSDEEFYWISEVFSNVSEKIQSREFIRALQSILATVSIDNYDQSCFRDEHMRKYVDYDEYVRSIQMEIDYAEDVLKDTEKC